MRVRTATAVCLSFALLYAGSTAAQPGPPPEGVWVNVQGWRALTAPDDAELSQNEALAEALRQGTGEGRVDIGAINRVFAQQQAATLSDRHAKAGRALTQMQYESAAIASRLRGTRVLSALHLHTNPWASRNFRSLWDRVGSYGSVLGYAAAGASALGLFSDDAGHRAEEVGYSLLLTGGSQLLGSLFGKQQGERFESATRWVELTRRSYDYLGAYHLRLSAGIAAADTFYWDIKKYNDSGVHAAANTDETKKAAIRKAAEYLHRFEANVLPLIQNTRLEMERLVNSICPGAVEKLTNTDSSDDPAACTYQFNEGGERQSARVHVEELDRWIAGEAGEDLRALRAMEADTIAAAALADELRLSLLAPLES